MKKVFGFIVAAFILASCTLSEKVVFDNKFGGNISYELDATEFANFMSMADSTGQPFNFGDSVAELSTMATEIKNINGISNIQFTSNQNKVMLSFSFKDIEALNNAHAKMAKETETLKPETTYEKVQQKGKNTLVYRTWPLGESAEDSSYLSMGMLFTYKLDVQFPKKVKEVNSNFVEKNGNTIHWESQNMDLSPKYAFDGIEVRF